MGKKGGPNTTEKNLSVYKGGFEVVIQKATS